MNRLFRWGIMIALLILIGSGLVSIRLIFVEDRDVEVPSLVGLSLVEASSSLHSAGLSARPDMVDSDQPRDVVVYQAVPAGEKAAKGNVINLKVSRGGALINIPDVRGMQFAEAVKALDASGLKLGSVLRVPDQMKPAGVIIAQNPASPAGVISSRMVELLVSEGRAGLSTTVPVPDVRGEEEQIARQIIEQNDLIVSQTAQLESKLVLPGSVVQTQPKAGTRVQSGASVKLFIAKAPVETPPQPIETTPVQNVQQNTAPVPILAQGAVPPVIPVDQDDASPFAPPSSVPVIPAETPTPPVNTAPPAPPLAPASGKTAKLRYQVPPLSRALPLRIEITDSAGTRVLQDRQANGGEYISLETPYAGSANIAIQLGSEVIWQEKYE